jgi:hypothetical protein
LKYNLTKENATFVKVSSMWNKKYVTFVKIAVSGTYNNMATAEILI